MLAGFIGGMIALYVTTWIALIATAHSEYMKAGTRSDGDLLLAATFFGPLVMVIDVPKFIVTIVTLIKQRIRD